MLEISFAQQAQLHQSLNLTDDHDYQSSWNPDLAGFYPSPKSFWSCTHVNSCQYYILYINLHILLNILCKATLNIQESRESIKFLKR